MTGDSFPASITTGKVACHDLNFGTNFNFALQRNTFAFVETGIYKEKIFEEEFGLKRSTLRGGAFAGDPTRSAWQHYVSGNINSTPIKKLNFGAFLGHIINAYDFDFGGNRTGNQLRLDPDASSTGREQF